MTFHRITDLLLWAFTAKYHLKLIKHIRNWISLRLYRFRVGEFLPFPKGHRDQETTTSFWGSVYCLRECSAYEYVGLRGAEARVKNREKHPSFDVSEAAQERERAPRLSLLP